MSGTQTAPAAELRVHSPRPSPSSFARHTRCLLVAALLTGCDQFKTDVPPPPSFADREAMRQAKLEKEAQAAGPVSDTASSSPSDASPTTPPATAADDDVPNPNNSRRITPHTEWTVEETAADALGRIGAASVPALVECLQDERPELRRRAAQVLARIGPDAAIAVPALTQLLHDQDPAVQREAARALGQIGPSASTAIPDLLQLFNSPAAQ